MTGIGNIFLYLSIPCAAIGVALMMAMVSALHSRGHKINWPLLRLYVPWYVGQYREVTIGESGRPGPLFNPFVVSMNSALVLAAIGLFLHAI
jgi:hypothetical protein